MVSRLGRVVVRCAALLALSRAAVAQGAGSNGFTTEPLTITRDGGTLHGTLLLPAPGASFPVVFIHPGSGPTDRDGNTPLAPGRNNSLRLLAEGLAARGVASLRIDKRGIGASRDAAPDESSLRFETYAADAAAWLRRLKDDPRFDRVLALGHSEGALIVALAAEAAGADGYVSLAGPAEPGAAVLRRQLAGQLPKELLAESDRILRALEQGRTAAPVPAPLQPLYRPSVQPYLISWFRHTPTDVVRRLSMPVLIAQGTTDLQVQPRDADALRAARPDAAQLRVTGMNHVLKLIDGPAARQWQSYGDSTLAVAPALIEGIADFVHQRVAK